MADAISHPKSVRRVLWSTSVKAGGGRATAVEPPPVDHDVHRGGGKKGHSVGFDTEAACPLLTGAAALF
jgi:hypothetical protein